MGWTGPGSESREVLTDLHPRDEMLDPLDRQAYFDIGESAVRAIKTCIGDREPKRILDLPCGHGRVLRHLRAEWPEAHITACDIDVEGMMFCAETFDAEPLYTSHDSSEIQTGHYQLIWCGSLLTHVDAPQWGPWLDFFEDHLTPFGTLVFTTHGRVHATGQVKHMPPDFASLRESYERTGFAFDADYNISLSSPTWVMEHLKHRAGDVTLLERGWHGLQDVWALSRDPRTARS